MCRLQPGIVLTSITPFGQTGPYAQSGYRGSDIVTYAMGGPMWGTGIDGREPVKLSGDVTSYQVGNLAAVPTLAAFHISQRSGRPAHVDVSAFEAQAGTIDRRTSYLIYQAYTGADVSREPRQPQRASPGRLLPRFRRLGARVHAPQLDSPNGADTGRGRDWGSAMTAKIH